MRHLIFMANQDRQRERRVARVHKGIATALLE
jgi:hypothetical protein